MNCGMATIAGTVLVLYATLLGPIVPNALGHLLVASIVATPVAIVVAAIMVPPQLTDACAGCRSSDRTPMHVAALTRGTLEGLQLLLNIVAMLVVFVALVALVNGLLGAAAGRGRCAADPRAHVRLAVCAAGVADRRSVRREVADGRRACWARRPC